MSQEPTPSRRSQACQRCWKRKQKCDRLIPRCTSCAELDVECITRSQDIESLLNEDTGLSHASIHSYVLSLQNQAKGLQNGSSQSPPAKRRRTRSELEPVDLNGNPSPHTAVISPSVSDAQAPPAEDAAVRDTMGAIGFLSNSAMAETRTGVEEAVPTKMALADLILSALAVAGQDPSVSYASRPSVLMDKHQIPISRETSIEHYTRFMSWSLFLPYLDYGRMYHYFEETVDFHSSKTSNTPQSLHLFTGYTSIATGIMMSPDADRLSVLAASLHSIAVKMLPIIFRDHTPMDALHCMAMLISYSLFSQNGGSAWHLVGIALKVCITLGLHKETPSPTGAVLGNDYDPRWLFWTLYSFDRVLCSTMDRPFGIRDGDITVQIPPPSDDNVIESSEQTKNKMACSRHIVRQAQLMSNIRCSGGTDPMILYHGLLFWRESLPPVRDLPFSSQYWSQSLDQMGCRLIMQIVNPLQQADSVPGFLRGTAEEVELDTVQLCSSLISTLYERSTADQPTGTFVDAYDVLSAAIILTCLYRRLGRQEPQHFATLMTSINKAMTVVTQIAGRFTALKAFQDTLLKLSGHVMELQYNTNETVPKPLQGIPAIVPRRLRKFLSNTFQ
ncbi:fungal specific transcription factor domain-containing protein [Sarocladium implicatum]|nr:fungal specific transcription factor domain-containing protein [Sarocladium implicatum]